MFLGDVDSNLHGVSLHAQVLKVDPDDLITALCKVPCQDTEQVNGSCMANVAEALNCLAKDVS